MAGDRLHGFSMLQDDRSSVILGNTLEVFADRHEAGFVVGGMDGRPPETMTFRNLGLVSHIRNLIDLMRDTAGLPSLPSSGEPNPQCVICQGKGFWEDEDLNQRDCEACR